MTRDEPRLRGPSTPPFFLCRMVVPMKAEHCAARQEGSRASFEELYRRWWTLVYSVARDYGLSHDDAADIAQTVFARLWISEAAGDIAFPQSYLWRAGSREARRLLMRNNRWAELPTDISSQAPGPEETATANEWRRLVAREFARLPRRCALAMSLVFLEGMTEKEVAARMGVSTKAVEKQVHRGRRLLLRSMSWLDNTSFMGDGGCNGTSRL